MLIDVGQDSEEEFEKVRLKFRLIKRQKKIDVDK